MHTTQLYQGKYLFEIQHGLAEPWGLRLCIPLIEANKLAIETQDLKFFREVSEVLADIPRLEALNYFDGFDMWFCQGNKIHKAMERHSSEELAKIKKQAELVIQEIDESCRAYVNSARFLAALKEYSRV